MSVSRRDIFWLLLAALAFVGGAFAGTTGISIGPPAGVVVAAAFLLLIFGRRKQPGGGRQDNTYAAVLDGLIDPVFVRIGDRIVFANRAAKAFFGDAPETPIIGRSPLALFAADEHEKALNARQTDEEPLWAPRVVRRADGSIGEVDLSALPTEWNGVPAVQVVMRDVAAQRASQNALAYSEAKLRLITDHHPNLVAYIGQDETFEFINQTGVAWFGEPAGGVLNTPFAAFAERHLAELENGMTGEAYVRRLRQALRGETVYFEGRRTFKDGKPRVVEGQMVPHKSGDGRVLGVLWVVNDITRRFQSELKLRRSEQQYRELLEVAPDPLFVLRNDEIVFANRAAAMLFDYPSPEDLVGRDPIDFYHPAEQEAARERRRNLLASEEMIPVAELTVNTRQGKTVQAETRGRRVSWEGEPAVLLIIRNIEARMRAFGALSAARDDAEETNRASSRFLASVSEEMRTTMTSVVGASAMLLEEDLDEQSKELIEVIRGSGQMLLTVFDDILEVARVEAGSLELAPGPADPIAAAQGVLESLGKAAEQRGVSLSLCCNTDIPVGLVGDQVRLKRILLGLSDTAMKQDQVRNVTIQLGCEERRDGPRAVVLRGEVRCDGTGISEDDQALFLTPVATLDDAIARRQDIQGLGLAVCATLIEAMGGQLGVESDPGRGGGFWFTVPMAHGGDASLPSSGEACSAGGADLEIRPLRMLVVDDNAINRQVAVAICGLSNLEIETVDSGQACLDLLAVNPVDVILMDIQMPDMDGVATTQRIRALDGDIAKVPVIAVTANAMKGDRERYLEAGLDDYVSKPVEAALLFAAIERLCGVKITQTEGNRTPAAIGSSSSRVA